jgi:hypothetical protein
MPDWGEIFTTAAEGFNIGMLKRAAQQKAEHLLELSSAVARRELKAASGEEFEGHMDILVEALDNIARTDDGRRAEFAAELAEYAESLS